MDGKPKLDPLDTLARTLWGEARGEGYNGMVAVANVIMNRVKRPTWWGNDVVSVCTKPWQFSCWNKSDPNRDKLINVGDTDPQFKTCQEIARAAVDGDLADITSGATSYFDRRMARPPKWAEGKEPCAVIGHHNFYRV